jgi:hypothetical protein
MTSSEFAPPSTSGFGDLTKPVPVLPVSGCNAHTTCTRVLHTLLNICVWYLGRWYGGYGPAGPTAVLMQYIVTAPRRETALSNSITLTLDRTTS